MIMRVATQQCLIGSQMTMILCSVLMQNKLTTKQTRSLSTTQSVSYNYATFNYWRQNILVQIQEVTVASRLMANMKPVTCKWFPETPEFMSV